MTSNSPLESLAAFVIVFVTGMLSTICFNRYVAQMKQQAAHSDQVSQSERTPLKNH